MQTFSGVSGRAARRRPGRRQRRSFIVLFLAGVLSFGQWAGPHLAADLPAPAAAATSALFGEPAVAHAGGGYTGLVFADYNANGVRDSRELGIAGVEVHVYSASGEIPGSPATTAACTGPGSPASVCTAASDAYYTFDTAGSIGPYRFEFVLPGVRGDSNPGELRDYLWPGAGGSEVLFVPDGGGVVDAAFSSPSDYCQSVPELCTPIHVNGDPSVTSGARPPGNLDVVYRYPYDESGYPGVERVSLAKASAAGALWGAAWDRSTQTLFLSAVLRRHAGFGPLGPDGIYAIQNPAGPSPTLTPWLDLSTLGLDLGADPRNPSDPLNSLPGDWDAPSRDQEAYRLVGKMSIGDIDLAEDGRTLYVMDLNNRQVIAIDIASRMLVAGWPKPLTNPGCAAGNFRPWALKAARGALYAGVVCSAESSQSRDDLRAHVLRFDGTSFSSVFSFDLDYPRGHTQTTQPAEWNPWTIDLTFNPSYPQPILTDIEFDTDGSLILGFQDRNALQVGNRNWAPQAGDSQTYFGLSGGDILRACPLSGGGWTLENNSACGLVASTLGRDTGEGPPPGGAPDATAGYGEFYWGDWYSNLHDEIALGGLALLPGSGQVVSSIFDPFQTNSGGVAWFNNVTFAATPTQLTVGGASRRYELYGQSTAAYFGKSGGIGDLEVLCDSAPIEIGDRVWNDTDGDGQQDPGENGVPGAVVGLYDASGVLVAMVETDANGRYLFSSKSAEYDGSPRADVNAFNFGGGIDHPEADYGLALDARAKYTVAVPAANFDPGGPLAGFFMTIANLEGTSNDPNVDNSDSDHGRVSVGSGASAAQFGVVYELQGAGANNHSLDFGVTQTLYYDWGDLPGLYPTLNIDNGAVHVLDGATFLGSKVDAEDDGQPDLAAAGDDRNPPTSDDEDGIRFLRSLLPGIPAPLEVIAAVPGFLNAWFDWNGDGVLDSSERIFSDEPLIAGSTILTVTAPAGSSPAELFSRFRLSSGQNEATTPSGQAPNGEVEDYVLLSLGNRVWLDDGRSGGGADDGRQNGGEPGVPGLTVELLDAQGTVVAATTTTAGGDYLFTGLPPGDYRVRIPATEFANGRPLAGYRSSTGAGDPNADADQTIDENGVDVADPTAEGVRSAAITLSAGGEPDSAVDGNGTNSNLTLDFGFVRFDLALRKSVLTLSDSPLVPGVSKATFSIEVINQGSVTATNIEVIDYVGAGFTYLPADNPAWTQAATTEPTTLIAGPILPGQSTSVAIVLGVAADAAGQTLLNYAEVAADNQPAGADADSTPDRLNNDSPVKDDVVNEDAKARPGVDDEDDHDIASVTVGAFDLALRKIVSFAPTPIVAGVSRITFGIQVFNQGDVPAYNVQISDYLPAGLTFDAANSPGWTQNGSTIVTTIPGPITPSGSATLNLVLAVATSAAGQTVTNFAEISAADNDQNDQNPAPIDIDSTPDAINANSPGEVAGVRVDDEINANGKAGGDEDDHDLAALAVPGVALGNLIWHDANDNGVVDPSEAGLDGVTVQLFRGGENPLTATPTAVDVTSGGGLYGFDNLAAGDYFVYIPISPAGYPASSSTTDTADNRQDNDDNGSQSTLGGPVTSPTVTLTPGEEPTGDGDGANGDLTLDFGFYAPVRLGNLVWHDANDSGTVDPGETGIGGVTVQLFRAGVDPTTGTPIAVDVTDGGGEYTFDGLSPGSYFVYLPAPPAAYPASSTPTDVNDNGQDNDDNGSQITSGAPVIGPVVTLTAGQEPTGDGDDADGDLTLDFGFYAPLTLGNLVWHDANNNGLVDSGETGVGGVTVQLFRGGTAPGVDPPLTSTVTDGDGLYRFAGLAPGQYFVLVLAPPAAFPTSSTVTDTADNGQDNDDNGSQTVSGGPATSPVITLVSGDEPTNDGDGANGDLTIDFGFYAFDLALRKTVKELSSDPLVPGQSRVTFSITIYNQGDVPASGVTLIDYLQPGLTYSGANNPGWSAGPHPTRLVPGPIAPGGSITVEIVLGVAEGTLGQTLTNVAEIAADGQPAGTDVDSTPDSQNSESPVKDDVISENAKARPGSDDEDDHDVASVGVERFDLALRKRVVGLSETPPVPGLSRVTFEITVFNQGETPATNVAVIDYVGSGFTYSQGANPGWSAGPNPSTVIAGPIPPGGNAAVQIVLGIAAGTGGQTLRNFSEVLDDNEPPGADADSTPDGVNNESPVKDDVIDEDGKGSPGVEDEDDHDVAVVELARFDLALRKTLAVGQPAAVMVGDDIDFMVEILNQGDLTATQIVVIDYLPAGLSLSPNDANGWMPVSGGVETTVAGPIPPGGRVALPIVLRAGLLTGDLTNEAEIRRAEDENGNEREDVDSRADGVKGNDVQIDDVVDNSGGDEDDDDIASVRVDRFDLALRKTLAAGQPSVIDPQTDVAFTITVFNQGTLPAAGVGVIDYLPPGFTLSPNDTNGWTLSGSNVQKVLNDSIAPGSSVSLPIVLRATTAVEDIFTNVAEIYTAPRPDIDSTPDTVVDNDRLVDDEINDDGTIDEDDHDSATITVQEIPTAVTLTHLTVVPAPQGNAVLWSTIIELNTLGFHIYRSINDNFGAAVRLTDDLIVPQGFSGGDYRYDDRGALTGVTYVYWLVEVEQHGDSVKETVYGPVRATATGLPGEGEGGRQLYLPLVDR